MPTIPSPGNTRPTRYSDTPPGLPSRLAGMTGVIGIALMITGTAFITWHHIQPVRPVTALSVFDVAPPASPPQPSSEIPPGPKQKEKKQEQLLRKTEVPPVAKITLPGISHPITPLAPAVVDPGPPVHQTTAPESQPAPPAQSNSNDKPTWEGRVLAALNKVKRYPADSAFRREQGIPYIRLVLNRKGRVLSVTLERSSGFRSLDKEALALPKRAQPLPHPPDTVKGDTIDLVIPVEFFISR